MGIAKSAFKLLLEEAKKRAFQGRKILQLGRQHTFLTFAQAQALAKKTKFLCSNSIEARPSFSDDLKKCHYIDDITLFSLLGFSEIHSLDVSSYEESSFIHDLNQPVPIELEGQYDVVFDGGTLEHVFHIPQVFKNIHRLLKPEGRIIHSSPSHNHVDHGFYMFSPTLFSEYYLTNSYEILTSYIFEYGFEHNSTWEVFEYKPGCLDTLSFGGFGWKMLGVWFIAQKHSYSTEGLMPQQGAYKTQWLQEMKKMSSTIGFRAWLKKSNSLRSLVNRGKKKISQFKTKHFQLKKVGSF